MRRTLSLWLAASLVLSSFVGSSMAQTTGATGAAGATGTTGATGGTTGAAGPAAAGSTQTDARGFLTKVSGSNPFAQEVVQLAKDLRQQYLEFYTRVALWPQNVGEIMERYRQYFATYQAYFQAVRNYLAEEQRSRSFSGRVFARYPLMYALPGRPIPMTANGAQEPAQTDPAQDPAQDPSQDPASQSGPGAPDAMIARPDQLDVYPLEGATVSLSSRDSRARAFYQLTNVRGAFAIPNLAQGVTYQFRVEMEGFEAQTGEITIASTSVRRRFVLEPRIGGDLYGQVLGLTPNAMPLVADVIENKKSLDEATSAQIAEAVGRPVPPQPGDPQATSQRPISLENIEISGNLELNLRNAGQHVIRNRAELRDLIKGDGPDQPLLREGQVDIPGGVNFERETLLVVALGGRPTGGYGVKITSVTRELPGNVYTVFYSEGKPGPDSFVTQAFTYPTAAVTIRHRIGRRAQVNFINNDATPPPEPQFMPLSGVEVRLSPFYRILAADQPLAASSSNTTGNTSPTADAAPGAPASLTIARPMPQEYSATTDEWGNFGFTNVIPGSYRVEVKAQGYLFYSGQQEISPGTSGYSPIYLVPDNFLPPPPQPVPAAETQTEGNNLDDPFNQGQDN